MLCSQQLKNYAIITLDQLQKEQFAKSFYELNDELISKIREGKTSNHNVIRANIDLIIKQAKAETLAKLLNEIESQAANLL